MTSWRLEVHEELGSTSDECVARAHAGENAGLAILAMRQTAGRGSRGRAWEAPAGNLNLSVLLRPDRLAAEAGLFSLLAGISVLEALEAASVPDLQLKWPNDVLLNGAKIAGILIDAAPSGDGLEWLVVGIGVNLAMAPSIPGRKTACLAECGISLTPYAIAEMILERLFAWQDAQGAVVRAAWLARAHAVGTWLNVQTGGRCLAGAFEGLTQAGELRLRTEDRIETINTGDVLLGQP